MNFDIIVIGGSFNGMTAALALAGISDDLKIAVIERQNIIAEDRKRDGRAYAISASSLKLFKEIGIFDEVIKDAGVINDIKITDYKSSAVLDFIASDVEKSDGNFGFLIENFYIHNALRNQILQRKNITLFCPNSYEEISFENGCLVKLDDGKILSSKLLLGCDGRISKLRDKFNIHATVKKYHQIAIVFNIKHQKSHENVAYEKFLTGGPLAILPLKNMNESSIVWISPDQEAKAILSLDEENFAHQLIKKMENCLGDVEVISEKFSYPLILVEAEKFYYEKMLLVGDAAVGVHPIAGQGFNLGMEGIKILRDLVKNNLMCGLDISSQSLIDSYNKKTKFIAKKMIVATDILNSLFETKSLSARLARDFGLKVVNKIPTLKKFFIKSAGGF